MKKKRFCAFILTLVMLFSLFTMLPTAAYAEDPPGTVRVSDQTDFDLAVNNGSVTHIIAESMELDIQQRTELTKDLTITDSASLRIGDKGLLIVHSGVTMTLDGSAGAVIGENGELRIGGRLINNEELIVSGIMSAAAPAVIVNEGTVVITDDPERGFGHISFFDIISDTGPNPEDFAVLPVTVTGSALGVTSGAINWIADVNGPASLDYAMTNPTYDGIWFTEFHDDRNEETGQTTGVAITYTGDLEITKPLDIFDNDTLIVNGNLINNSEMFIGGTLTVSGSATNNGHYIQTAKAILNKEISDSETGTHIRGYYVTNQAEWETALSDAAHCNPIVIGSEVTPEVPIVISTDTAISCTLIVDGNLTINQGVYFTLNMNLDLYGNLTNNGTIEINKGIAINNSATLRNNTGGVIRDGYIGSWGGLDESNTHPIINLGLIRKTFVDLDYAHLVYRYIDNTGEGWFENLDGWYDSGLYDQPGGELYAAWGLWDYVDGNWGFVPISPSAITIPAGSGIEIQALPSDEIYAAPDKDTTNSASYAEISVSQWGDYSISYTTSGAIGDVTYHMPVTVDLPDVWYYSAAVASQENYIREFSYSDDARSFYLIAKPDVDPSWTHEMNLREGGSYATVEATADPDIFLATVKDGVAVEFTLDIELRYFEGSKLMMTYGSGIRVSKAPCEGLVFSWPDWRHNAEADFHYPVIQKDGEGIIHYQTALETAVGGITIPLFYRYQDGENWTYQQLSAGEIGVTSGSGIRLEAWSSDGSDTIVDTDYTDYNFLRLDLPNFGDYELSYSKGSQTFTLPISVGLPGTGYYLEAVASQENYIREFYYSDLARNFYLIAKPDISIEDGWTCSYEIFDGNDKVDITTTGAMGTFLVTIKDAIKEDARLHAVIRYRDSGGRTVWESDRDIWMHQAEIPGLVYSWTNWESAFPPDSNRFEYPVIAKDGEGNIHYDREINVAKGSFTYAFFFKHWEGDESAGAWAYTRIPEDKLIIATGSGITKETWAHEDIAHIPAGDKDYHDYIFTNVHFDTFGDWTIGYQDGEGGAATLYELPVHIALPGLGAYTSTAGGEENWLADVEFSLQRTVYLVPTRSLSDVDLANSEFNIDGASLTYDAGGKTYSKAGYMSIAAHEAAGEVDYFTAEISANPFDNDFNLDCRLRDASNQEVVFGNIYFKSDLANAQITDGGLSLARPGPGKDTSVRAAAISAQSAKYYTFTAGSLADQAYAFGLSGACSGARLYLFDSDWKLLGKSSFENLNDRDATFYTSTLVGDQTYYLVAHNESGQTCDLLLRASLQNIPAAPLVSLQTGAQGTIGVTVSGGGVTQTYIMYAKVNGEWHRRGDRSFDENDSPCFLHAFDFINDGETATSLAVAIEQNGVEGPRAEVAVSITRADTQSAGYAVTLMDFSENDTAFIRAAGADRFRDGGYFRFRHEDASSGQWIYNGSFFGDGSNIAGGGAYAGDGCFSFTGRWLLTEYKQTGSGTTYNIGWESLMDSDGDAALGSLAFDVFDVLKCDLKEGEKKVDATLHIRTLTSSNFAAVDVFFAIYDSAGRLVDIVTRSDTPLGEYGTQKNEALHYTDGHQPKRCKAFILNDTFAPLLENLEVAFPE